MLYLGSSEISDANNKQGSLEANPINYGHHVIGKCFYIPAFDNTNWHVHEKAELIPEDSIVVIVGIMNPQNNAIIGELVARYLIEKKRVKGIVVLGRVRDVPAIIKNNWPVWCRGTTPIGTTNKYTEPTHEQLAASFIWENTLNDTYVVCDDTGVVYFKEDIQEKIIEIQKREELWQDQLNLGMSTFEIVCKRKGSE